jgi:hypothetical protein
MNYEGLLTRPPAESASLLLQVTVGSRRRESVFHPICCDKEYQVKSLDLIAADVEESQRFRLKHVFLCDADALAAPPEHTLAVLQLLQKTTPWVEQVAAFVEPDSVLQRSVAEWKQLADLGLNLLYFSLESGDGKLRSAFGSIRDTAKLLEARRILREAGIQVTAMVMLGLAGHRNSERHVVGLADLLNEFAPEFIEVYSVKAGNGGLLDELLADSKLLPPDPVGLMQELYVLIDRLVYRQGILTAYHSSNPVQLRCAIPVEKIPELDKLRKAIYARRDAQED